MNYKQTQFIIIIIIIYDAYSFEYPGSVPFFQIEDTFIQIKSQITEI